MKNSKGIFCLAVVCFVVILSIGLPQSSSAHTVYLKTGDKVGQAYAFYIRGIDGCVAITAAHLVEDGDTAIELFGIGGEYFTAETISINPIIDLALLRLLPDSNPNFNAVCQTGFGTSPGRSPIVPTSVLLTRSGPRAAWIERVVSPAGGIDREFVPGRFKMRGSQIQIPTPFTVELSQGDSGAPIWASFEDASSTLQDADLEDRIQQRMSRATTHKMRGGPRGDLLGLLSSIDDDNMYLITTDQINEFVANAFTPIDWEDISIQPENVQVVQRWRGGIPGPSSIAATGFVHRHLDGLLGLELDLGGRDFLLYAIEFEYSENIGTSLGDIGSLRWWFPAKVLVGSYRPAENVPEREKRYRQVNCRASDVSPTASEKFVVSCVMQTPLIVRSMQLIVGGHVDKIRSIKLLKHESLRKFESTNLSHDRFSSFLGTWSGLVNQPGFGTYPITIELKTSSSRVLSGSVDYPTLACGGSIDKFRIFEDTLSYTESISGGTCITEGIVKIRPSGNNTILWQWFHPVSNHLMASTELMLVSKEQR